jgi:hypothetical protein
MAVHTELIDKHLNGSWQARTLDYATDRPGSSQYVYARHRFGAVLLSMLAHRFDDDQEFLVLMHCVHPFFRAITGPILSSIGRINKSGCVVADMVHGGMPRHRVVLFPSVRQFEGECRRFCDKMHFRDQERIEFFEMVKLWLAADERLDPSMNPHDPDAKRLVH